MVAYSIHSAVRVGVRESSSSRWAKQVAELFDCFPDTTHPPDLEFRGASKSDVRSRVAHLRLQRLGPGVLSDTGGSAVYLESTGELAELHDQTLFITSHRSALPHAIPLLDWFASRSGIPLVHAASASKSGDATLIGGWGGVGKTSALGELANRRGWSFLADDLTFVSRRQAKSFPKPVFIYPYHREIFPEVFETRPGAVVPAWALPALGGLRRTVRPVLRNFPVVESKARNLSPEYHRVPAALAYPTSAEIVSRADLRRYLHVERAPVASTAVRELTSVAALVDQVERIFWLDQVQASAPLISALTGAGLIDGAEWRNSRRSVIAEALEGADCREIQLPLSMPARDAASVIADLA